MENQTIEQIHRRDLYVKVTLAQMAETHKRMTIFALGSLLIAIFLLIADIVSVTADVGWAVFVFFFFAAVFFLAGRQSSRGNIEKTVAANLDRLPQRSVYTFGEEALLVESDLVGIRTRGEYQYDAILRVHRIDERTMYILFKNNAQAIIENDRVDEIAAFLATKMPPPPPDAIQRRESVIPVRFKRILAFIVDWLVSGVPVLLYAGLVMLPLVGTETPSLPPPPLGPILGVLLFFFILSWFVLFVLRDVIFGARSLGKRLFRMRVIDRRTGQTPTAWKRISRCLFFFFYYIDGIVLLITGDSIGDKVCDTTVVNT